MWHLDVWHVLSRTSLCFYYSKPSSCFFGAHICSQDFYFDDPTLCGRWRCFKLERKRTVFRCKAGMCDYVGHHYILISLTFPQLAQPTSQDAPIRPDSNLKPKSGQLLTNTSDLMKDAAALCHSVLHCRYTALCGLAPASALWSSLVKSGWGIPGGMKA